MTDTPPSRPQSSRPQSSRDDLIASLAEATTPVRTIDPRRGLALIALATVLVAGTSIVLSGFWFSGIFEGEASPFFWITNGLLLLLGIASSTALVASAMPQVGAKANAPKWAAAMLAVVPAAALLTLFSIDPVHGHSGLENPELHYWECSWRALIAGSVVAAAAVLFLRQGAPVSLERSGWLTGLAAGSLGSFAYGVTCPLDSLGHIGLIHVAPVAVAAIIGRLAVPRLIRW